MFFFFKQKPAYEVRISDWSSDVCSSDLPLGGQRLEHLAQHRARHTETMQDIAFAGDFRSGRVDAGEDLGAQRAGDLIVARKRAFRISSELGRSEEHTSELQSPMRISYAVFCLKKQNINTLNKETITTSSNNENQ